MSQWFALELGDGVEAYIPTTKIQEAFWPIFISCGSPKDMGIYSKYDLHANIVTIYFTPSAKQLALSFNAKECNEPSWDGVAFLGGPATCLDIWPVGRKRQTIE